MGAWGTGSFENDDAVHWITDLGESTDTALLEEALEPKEVEGYYLEAPEDSRILCAAEILAALLDRPSSALSEDAAAWVATHRALDPQFLIPKALGKIERVLAEHSELKELWAENEIDYSRWEKVVFDLKARLSG